jgi:hypothetical protein
MNGLGHGLKRRRHGSRTGDWNGRSSGAPTPGPRYVSMNSHNDAAEKREIGLERHATGTALTSRRTTCPALCPDTRLWTSSLLEIAESRLDNNADDRMCRDDVDTSYVVRRLRRVETIVAQRPCFSRSRNRVSMTTRMTRPIKMARTRTTVQGLRRVHRRRLGCRGGRDVWSVRGDPSCWPCGTSLDVCVGNTR